MHKVVVRGSSGEVRWGYLSAASLGDWTLTTEASVGVLTAQVVTSDAFRLSQPALTFRVLRPNGQVWYWPITGLHIADDGSISARIAPQE